MKHSRKKIRGREIGDQGGKWGDKLCEQEPRTCEYNDNNYSDIHYDFGPIHYFSTPGSLQPNYQLSQLKKKNQKNPKQQTMSMSSIVQIIVEWKYLPICLQRKAQELIVHGLQTHMVMNLKGGTREKFTEKNIIYLNINGFKNTQFPLNLFALINFSTSFQVLLFN